MANQSKGEREHELNTDEEHKHSTLYAKGEAPVEETRNICRDMAELSTIIENCEIAIARSGWWE